LAGGIVGAVIFFALSISLFLWYRRKSSHRKIMVHNRDPHKDKPAPAADVLNRPDPTEKLTIRSSQQSAIPATAGNADPESHGTTLPPPSRPHLTNPFDDSNSIQTTKTEGPNVIPIALVSPESSGSRSDTDTLSSTHLSAHSSGPVRPPRSPDLNLEHVNVSNDNLRQPYAVSTISGISAISTNSYMSGASYSSDFLNEAPVIVTANKSPVHQVLNVLRAEVVPAGNIPSPSDSSLKSPLYASRPAITSPLAATSFGPNDVLKEVDEDEVVDPFEDNHSMSVQGGASPIINRFGPIASKPGSTNSKWMPDDPTNSSTQSDGSRPSSISTQAGSVANIGSVTRLDVGLGGLASPSTFHGGTYRTTMGRLVSPLSSGSLQPGSLQDQQARAYAQTQGSKRISGSSVISAASTKADSILEAFPFVPPSPISDRPIRSPPVSPLGNCVAAASPPQSPTGVSAQSSPPVVTVAPASPLSQRDFKGNNIPTSSGSSDGETLPAPPNRHTLGMSTGSQLSTTSTGLGQFPFQIDTGSNSDVSSSASRPTTLNVRHRASLDTLALTSDLTSYPLDFTPPLPRQPPIP